LAVHLLHPFGYYERYGETETLSEADAAELLDRCGIERGHERVVAFKLLMEVAQMELMMREPPLRLQQERATSRDMDDDIAFRKTAATAVAATVSLSRSSDSCGALLPVSPLLLLPVLGSSGGQHHEARQGGQHRMATSNTWHCRLPVSCTEWLKLPSAVAAVADGS
jgi:hypothetical protein